MCNNTILIPIDFSDVCYSAVLYGLEFCRQYKLNAELFHVDTGVESNPKVVAGFKHVVDLYIKKFGIGVSFVEVKGELLRLFHSRCALMNMLLFLWELLAKAVFNF